MKLVMLTGQGDSSTILHNGLKDSFHIEKIIIENPVNQKKFLKRRIKRLGYVEVLGQILFVMFCVKLIKLTSTKRLRQIFIDNGLSSKKIDKSKIIEVNSVNSSRCLELLQELKPQVVIVNGTRIISKKILDNVDAVFLNSHAGITPAYRGVHGGYWALVNNDLDNCGVTVHLVDKGIDTGGILYQKRIDITKKDNFCTYKYLQLTIGIILMKKAIKDVINNEYRIVQNDLKSKLYYHPTIWYYLWTRINKGIK